MFSPRRSRPARAMCGSTPGVVITSVAFARCERGELGERAPLGGITAHEERRVGRRDVQRRIDPRRATVLPRPHQAQEEAPVVGIRGVERSEVDARTPDDVRHPQGRIAGDRGMEDDRGRALPRVEVWSPAVPVRVAVGVQAQAGARPDLEQGDRAVDTAQRRQQRRAPQRLVRLQAAGRALRDDLIGVGRHPIRPLGVRALRSAQHARHGEHQRRLAMRRRDAAEDRGHRAIGGHSRGPLGVQVRSARGLVAREASVAVGDLGGDGGGGIHRPILAVNPQATGSPAATSGVEWTLAEGGPP